jgi:hypothetical protein
MVHLFQKIELQKGKLQNALFVNLHTLLILMLI